MNSDYSFHHIGIATKNIEKCANAYGKFGYSLSDIKIEPTQSVRIAFLSREGAPMIELVEPLTDDSPVSRLVKQSGTTPYHTCWEVSDIEKSAEELEELNFRLLFEPMTSEAMDEGLFCYLFSPETGLIEIFQRAMKKK
jgi:methylmalonyl-CoA/ethylmalonyl-CoA epimerase